MADLDYDDFGGYAPAPRARGGYAPAQRGAVNAGMARTGPVAAPHPGHGAGPYSHAAARQADDPQAYDPPYRGPDHGYPAGPGRAQRLVNIAGAASSLALVLGLGFWGYKLAVRDVNGVPVIRAMAGPMRIAPDDPGGKVAAHQGLAVNAVAAAGSAMPLPDAVTLAPRAAELDEADGAGLGELPPLAMEADSSDEGGLVLADDMADDLTADPEDAALADTATVPLDAMAALPSVPPVAEGEAAAIEAALADAIAAGAEPLTPIAAPQADGMPPEEAMAALPQGAMAKSLRPPLRPARAAAAGAAPAGVTDVQSTTAAAPVPAEVKASDLKTGARLVQLGAFDTAEEARAEWARLQGRFGDLLTGKSLVVQSAESGGRTFWRLRAHGFDSADDSRRFCTAVLAEGAACIPVTHR